MIDIDELMQKTSDKKQKETKKKQRIRSLSEYQEKFGDLVPPKYKRPKWFLKKEPTCPVCGSTNTVEWRAVEGICLRIEYGLCPCGWEWASKAFFNGFWG